MGFIHETGEPLVGIESRRESVRLYDDSAEVDGLTGRLASQHVFTNGAPSVEVTHEWLRAFLRTLRDKPEIAAQLGLRRKGAA